MEKGILLEIVGSGSRREGNEVTQRVSRQGTLRSCLLRGPWTVRVADRRAKSPLLASRCPWLTVLTCSPC